MVGVFHFQTVQVGSVSHRHSTLIVNDTQLLTYIRLTNSITMTPPTHYYTATEPATAASTALCYLKGTCLASGTIINGGVMTLYPL